MEVVKSLTCAHLQKIQAEIEYRILTLPRVHDLWFTIHMINKYRARLRREVGVILNYYDYICNFNFSMWAITPLKLIKLRNGDLHRDLIILSQFALLNQIKFQSFSSPQKEDFLKKFFYGASTGEIDFRLFAVSFISF